MAITNILQCDGKITEANKNSKSHRIDVNARQMFCKRSHIVSAMQYVGWFVIIIIICAVPHPSESVAHLVFHFLNAI